MQLTASTKRQRRPDTFVIVVKTAKQFADAIHKIEAGGWRWWRMDVKGSGPNYEIHTNCNPEGLL
jgi:hypothetical protein